MVGYNELATPVLWDEVESLNRSIERAIKCSLSLNTPKNLRSAYKAEAIKLQHERTEILAILQDRGHVATRPL